MAAVRRPTRRTAIRFTLLHSSAVGEQRKIVCEAFAVSAGNGYICNGKPSTENYNIYAMKKIIASPLAPKAVGPYSQAVENDGTLYVSGQLPIDSATGKMPESIEEQTRQSLTNIRHIVPRRRGESYGAAGRHSRLRRHERRVRRILHRAHARTRML